MSREGAREWVREEGGWEGGDSGDRRVSRTSSERRVSSEVEPWALPKGSSERRVSSEIERVGSEVERIGSEVERVGSEVERVCSEADSSMGRESLIGRAYR
jgi:hypothetical protein